MVLGQKINVARPLNFKHIGESKDRRTQLESGLWSAALGTTLATGLTPN